MVESVRVLRLTTRGLRVFGAWLNHTDMKDDNALDMYVGGHLEHYLVDFGEAYLAMARERGLRSAAVIDHWVNYRERFVREARAAYPARRRDPRWTP